MKKNSSFDNQIILREEETEITEIESITDLIGDLSQGSPDGPDQSTVDERTFVATSMSANPN